MNGARQLYLLNETTQRLESLGQVNENNADIHLAAGDAFFDLYLFDKDLCGYSLTTGQKTKLLTFHHFDINASQVVRVLPVGKSKTGAPRFGCYVISDGLVSPVLLEHRVKEPERITLRIGTMRPEGDLPRAVNDFNYENTDYQIEVIKYAADDDASGMINFSKALAAGDIPDLLDLADLPEHTLIRQKLLRDLTPFIEADPDLSTESFLPNILDLLTHEDGSIYALTRDFSVHTMHTLRSQAGDIPDDWTFSDALAILDANPGFILPYQGGSVLSVLFCATYSVDHFVDWYNLTSSFDSPEFLTVLELISRSKTDQKSEYTTAFESFAAGEYLMFYDMALNRPLGFIDNFRARFGEDLQSPGFPGTGSTVWLQSKFAMTTHCMYPDGAWDFIRSTVLSVDGTEMPLNIPVLEAEYKACLDSWRTYYDKRVDDLRYIPTEEDFAAYDAIIRGAKAEDKTDYYVFPIMLEELETFFANEQSAVETAEAIQSRVTSLLAEMQ